MTAALEGASLGVVKGGRDISAGRDVGCTGLGVANSAMVGVADLAAVGVADSAVVGVAT